MNSLNLSKFAKFTKTLVAWNPDTSSILRPYDRVHYSILNFDFVFVHRCSQMIPRAVGSPLPRDRRLNAATHTRGVEGRATVSRPHVRRSSSRGPHVRITNNYARLTHRHRPPGIFSGRQVHDGDDYDCGLAIFLNREHRASHKHRGTYDVTPPPDKDDSNMYA